MWFIVARTAGDPGAKPNARGGAIALGHPIDASGGILATTLAYRMREEGAGRESSA